MSGRKISDMGGYPHTSDMAMKSKNKVRHYTSVEGAGAEDGRYPDTTEDIQRDQSAGVSKMKGRDMKPGYRY
jgi:hypothetical protein